MNTWEYRMPTQDGWSEWMPLTPKIMGCDEILEDGTLVRKNGKGGWIAEQADGNGMFRKVQPPHHGVLAGTVRMGEDGTLSVERVEVACIDTPRKKPAVTQFVGNKES